MTTTPNPAVERTASTPSRDIDHEASIEWVESIDRLDYVREAYLATPTWQGRPAVPTVAARLIGYADHAPPETTGVPPEALRHRRVFYLKPGDRGAAPDDPLPPDDPYAPPGAPCGAVDPRTVAPQTPGTLTERAWGGPLDCDGGEED